MTVKLKTTLEQWATLIAVNEEGSVQAAAEKLCKSHTTLLYSLNKLENQMGIPLIEVVGKKSRLTQQARLLLRKASSMIETAAQLEKSGAQLAQGYESQIVVSIDHLCNRQWLYVPMARFIAENTLTSVTIRETSLSSTTAFVKEQLSDVAIINLPVENHSSSIFGLVNMYPVVGKGHHLSKKKRVSQDDLVNNTQIVIRDLGSEPGYEGKNVGWLKAQRRITVDNFDHAVDAASAGLGFCRLPDHILLDKKACGLVRLDLSEELAYQVPLHLTLPKGDNSGPSARLMHQYLMDSSAERARISLP